MSANELFLEIADGPGKGTRYQLLGESAVIGRGKGSDIVLAEARGVSRTHVQTYLFDGKLRIKDLGSQNGTVVEGKKVKEAILPPGTKFRIGDTTLRLVAGTALPAKAKPTAPAPTPGGQVAAPAAEEHALAAAGGEIGAEQVMQAAGQGSASAVMWLVFIVLLFVVGFYLANMMDQADTIDTTFDLVSVREQKVLNFHQAFEEIDVPTDDKNASPAIKAERYKGLLSKVISELKNEKHILQRDFVVVTGLNVGDAVVQLKTTSGVLKAERRVLVRGIKPHLWKTDLTAQEAKDRALQCLNDAEILKADGKIYEAIKQYQIAEELSVQDVNLQDAARTDRSFLLGKLRKELNDIFEKALRVAFPDPNSQTAPDYLEAYRLLNEAKALVPDSTNLEFQVLEHWQVELEMLYSRRN